MAQLAQLRIDGAFEPDGFREEMETYIYGKIRETNATKSLLVNIAFKVHDKFLNFEGHKQGGFKSSGSQEDQVQNLLDMLKGKGKKGQRKRARAQMAAKDVASIAVKHAILRHNVTSPRKKMLTKDQEKEMERKEKESTIWLIY